MVRTNATPAQAMATSTITANGSALLGLPIATMAMATMTAYGTNFSAATLMFTVFVATVGFDKYTQTKQTKHDGNRQQSFVFTIAT